MIIPQYAQARPAVAASFAYLKFLKQPMPPAMAARLPENVEQADFNFLNPASRLFHTDLVLISASQYINQRPGTFLDPIRETSAVVIGDNGAHRIKTDSAYYQGVETAVMAQQWMDAHCHVGAIMDIPTSALGCNPQFTNFEQALSTTIANTEAMIRIRDPKKGMLLLNVLQGRTVDEFKDWYHAVKHYPLDGWAIGGARRLDFASLLWLVSALQRDGLLGHVKWLHVFGSFRMDFALALTGFKRALDHAAGRTIPVTCDASTPMTMAYERFRIYTECTRKGDRFPMRDAVLPTHKKFAHLQEPFPAAGSRISELITLGNVCVDKGQYGKLYGWDELSRVFAVQHNLDFFNTTLKRYQAAMDLEWTEGRKVIPDWILDIEHQGREVLASRDPHRELMRRSNHLSLLVKDKYQ